MVGVVVGSSLLLSLTQLPPTATVTFIELSLTKSQSFMLIGIILDLNTVLLVKEVKNVLHLYSLSSSKG